MLQRIRYALTALVIMVFVVLLDRDGYRDNADGDVSVLDAVYYASVSLSTTGYGDITPVTDAARLVNVIVILPLRVFFLALLVGTTFEVLGARTRDQWRQARWRSKLKAHTVVVGYGTKGRSAIGVLLANGVPKNRIVVIDPRPDVAAEAAADGLVAIAGDATRSVILRQAGVELAERVIVSADRDDTAVLVTLTVRQLNPTAPISAAVREAENAPLVRHSGANSVITSSEAAGRLLGMSATSPASSEVVGDLLIHGRGLDIIDRPVEPDEVGKSPRDCTDVVLAVVRGEKMLRFDQLDTFRSGDHLVLVHPQP